MHADVLSLSFEIILFICMFTFSQYQLDKYYYGVNEEFTKNENSLKMSSSSGPSKM